MGAKKDEAGAGANNESSVVPRTPAGRRSTPNEDQPRQSDRFILALATEVAKIKRSLGGCCFSVYASPMFRQKSQESGPAREGCTGSKHEGGVKNV